MTDRVELDIIRLGAQGDGVAETGAGPVYVPFTLEGEWVSADVEGERGRLVEVLRSSRDRVAAPCPHFGVCGGCALQHMATSAYLAWKERQVAVAFAQRGLDIAVAPAVPCAGKRRRAALAARQTSQGVLLGFHEVATHTVVDMKACEVLHPAIVTALPALRELSALVVSKKGETRVVATWTDAGVDVVLDDVNSALTAKLRTSLSRTAASAGFARISVNRDPVYEGLLPFLRFGRAQVVLPPGAFLQAVKETETAMAAMAVEAIGKAKAVADLFCGLGGFAFRIAERARVFAADSDKAAIAALQGGARQAQGLKPIEARLRDLFREPLSATELNDFDAIVFDPPRAGAEAQAKMISKSRVKTVVAVSCNPATLARDARILVDGGYKIEMVTPVDQFQYSPHIETVAIFRR